MTIRSARVSAWTELLAATTVPDTNTNACTNTLTAQANSLYVGLTATDVMDTVTLSAEISPDGGTTWFDHPTTWTVEISAAGNYFRDLSGLRTCPGDVIQISYQCETQAGDLSVYARSWEDAGGGGGGGSVSVETGSLATEATLAGIKTAVELLDNIVDGTEAQVDIVSSTLPTGAATETTLADIKTVVELLDDTVATEDAAVGTKGLQLAGEARTSQKSAMSANGDVALLVCNEHGELILAGYDHTNEFHAVSESSPVDQQYITGSSVLTNVPNATPDETVIISMDGYRGLCIHIEQTGGTDTFVATVYASVEGADAGHDWIDVTQYGFTAAHAATAASYTADCILFMNPGFTPSAIKVKITTASGSDDADFNVFSKKWY